ncbi:hypothetical protein SAMN04488564_104888 [Lentzea waywayandensis]|uniref:Uncharacterized protein n=1 Tax=Lentzea waywayandensis TaxID=84724 RepID=A0A1I6ELP3_9PSEU|nr:hypothetical protein [Lentzea waywayandensis]SFR18669.1 hypothetical protein SAMN04488564_104888 [Lentzea waywayandensis]
MSPQSKPRKKKQGKAPGRRPEQQSPYGALLESAAALRSESWLLADAWASELYATLWLAGSGTDPLVEALQKMNDPAALTALRALTGVGSEENRAAAFAAAETVAARGVAEPSWYVAGTVPDFRDAFLVTNLLGDVEVIAITQERAGVGETVLFMRQPVLGATAIELFATPDEGTVALLEDMIASTPEAFRDEITPLSAGDVYDRVWPDVEQFWEDGPDEEAEEGLMGEEDVRHPVQLIALADARVSALVPKEYVIPAVSPERTDEVVGAFLASEHGIADVEAARAFARIVVSAAVEQNRDPVVYGPASLTAVLILNVAARLHVSDEDLALLPEIVRAWAYFTVDARDLPRDEARAVWDEELPTVLAEFSEAYADPELVAERDGQFR